MVKIRISASINDTTWHKLTKALKNSRKIRNKSHFVEEAILSTLERGDIF